MARGHLVFAELNESLCRLLEAVASGDHKAFDPFTTNPCRSFLEYACALCGIVAWQRTFSKKR